MKIVNGEFCSAVVHSTDNPSVSVEDYALAQIMLICSQKSAEGSRIRIMPDVHPGKIGPVGLTMTLTDSIMPGLIGVDIGCGITVSKIRGKKIEYQKLDRVIRENIPSGFEIRNKVHRLADYTELEKLRCFTHINFDKAMLSLGSLGSGNHFIEIDRDDEGNLYAAVHSGSRHLGMEVSEYYLKEGQKVFKSEGPDIPYELTNISGQMMLDYLHDLKIVTDFASLNRKIILDEIFRGMKWKSTETMECIHNYVDSRPETTALLASPVLRKGAISALKDEEVIIPVNMRDGIIIGIGLGNADWNASAPHGSGRILNRSSVSDITTVSEFRQQMKGIWSGSINRETLDESPAAYRSLDDIVSAIRPSVKVNAILEPVYSFKAGNSLRKRK